MSTTTTKELYRQLRTATLQHDNATAVAVLQQIVQIDPADKKAAEQLKALQGKGKASAPLASAGKKKSNNATGKLYAQFRSACLSRDDVKAFEIIEKILSIAPDDEEAQQQRKELGLRLVKAEAAAFADIIATGNEKAISQQVEHFLNLADEDDLMTLPDFPAAYSIHKRYIQKRCMEHLQSLFAELEQLDSAFSREEKATEIEKYAEEHSLTIQQEQNELLTSCHDDWERTCRESEQYETFNQLIGEINSIRSDLETGADLAQLLNRINRVRESMQQLTEVEEVSDTLTRLQITRKKVLQNIRSKRTRKCIVSCITVLSGLVLFSAAGVVSYAYNQVEERTVELQTALHDKNATAVETLLQELSLIRFCYCQFDTRYAEFHERASRWLEQYHKNTAKIKAFEKWVDTQKDAITLENAKETWQELEKHKLLLMEMEKEYKYKINSELVHKIDLVYTEIIETVKPRAIARFSNPPANATVSELAELYKEYRQSKEDFDIFGDEINKDIQATYRDRLQRILISHGGNMDKLKATVTDIKQHASAMELPSEMLTSMDNILAMVDFINNRPPQLKTCYSLSDYIVVLKKYEQALSSLNLDISLEKLQQLDAKLPHLMMRRIMNRLAPETKALNNAEIIKKLTTLRNAYTTRKNLFSNFPGSEYSRIVDLMTLPESAPEWSNSYHQAVKGKTVYVGKTYRRDNYTFIQESKSLMGMEAQLWNLGENVKVTLLTHKLLREHTGFNRKELQRGSILPTTLMNNLAHADSENYAPLAKAYLFSLCIDLLSLHDDVTSGKAFSPSLQADINAFAELKKTLSRKNCALVAKCWCKRHSLTVDEKIMQYFKSNGRCDYAEEIVRNINNVLTSKPEFAGYINWERKLELGRNYPSENLYYVKNDRFVSASEGGFSPLTPVFFIKD